MKKKLRGSFTTEAAVIMPLVIGMFAVLISMLFYYHDKNIVTGAAYEIVTVGSCDSGLTKEELSVQLQERLNGKLLLFSRIHVNIRIDKTKLIIYCQAVKNGMVMKVNISMSRTEPERYIRNIRRFQKLGEQLGESERESIL